MEKTGFLEEKPTVKSASRLIALMFAIYAIAASAYMFIKGLDYTAGIAVFSSISAIAVGIKLIQKPMEKDSNDKAEVQ